MKPASWLRKPSQVNPSSPKVALGLTRWLYFHLKMLFILITVDNYSPSLLTYFPLIHLNLHNLCRNLIMKISSIMTYFMLVTLIIWQQKTGSIWSWLLGKSILDLINLVLRITCLCTETSLYNLLEDIASLPSLLDKRSKYIS